MKKQPVIIEIFAFIGIMFVAYKFVPLIALAVYAVLITLTS